MVRNVKLGVIFCSMILVLMACSKSDNPLSQPAQFSIVSSIDALGRAPVLDSNGQGYFSDGDVNTVFFHDGKGGLLREITYKYGEKYYWCDFQLGNTDSGLEISACYPQVNVANPADFKWNVLSVENATPDFLAASPVQVTQGATAAVQLHFKHMMHKLAVKLKADGKAVDDKELSAAKICVSGFKPTAVVDLLKTEVLHAEGNLSESKGEGAETFFILPPQNVGEIEVKVELGDRFKVFRLAECNVEEKPLTFLQGGNSFTLAITVGKTSFTISGQDIDPWGNQGEADGNIEI